MLPSPADALDPVYGAAFSWCLLDEQLGPRGFAGAAIILGGVALSRAAARQPDSRGGDTAEDDARKSADELALTGAATRAEAGTGAGAAADSRRS